MLAAIATPAAHAALRRFALSQAGEDDARMRALSALGESGGLEEDNWVRVWLNGAWQQVRMREYELVEEAEFEYTEQVADLLNQGLSAMQGEDYEQAERLYRQALALEPQARQAYNNLGVIYGQRGENAQARKMFEAALETDPTYVFPRCTLANDLIDEGDLDGAEEMLKPLRDVTRMQPTEMSFYAYTQARILVRRGEYDKARQALETALHFTPDYEPAQELIERIGWLEIADRLRTGYESLMERTQARNRTKRARLQTQLSTSDPTLAKALPLYTKNALTGMARIVLPRGGWSALRKGELIEEIISGLQDGEHLQRIVAELDEEEQSALRQVLAGGGRMPWEDFDAAYDNDLEESPHWNFHVPETVMGGLRIRGLLIEATVRGALQVVIPVDLRAELEEVLQ
jgi:Flp pilus assembly protein TadD